MMAPCGTAMLGRVQPQRLVTFPQRNVVHRRVVVRAATTVPSEVMTIKSDPAKAIV